MQITRRALPSKNYRHMMQPLPYPLGMDRTAAFATSLARLNIDERIFKLNERIGQAQGEAVGLAVERILVALGHPDPYSMRRSRRSSRRCPPWLRYCRAISRRRRCRP